MKKTLIFVLASMCSLMAFNALAQPKEPTPEELAQQAVDVRKSVKKLLAWNNAVLYDTLRRKRDFSSEDMGEAATRIAQLAAMLPDAFAADTSEFDGLETRALDGIWAGKEDFDAKAKNLADRATAMAAMAGDQKAILAELRKFGPDTCGDCHDSYRGD